MQKLNKNNFIPRALEIHNGKYSYTKTVYVKAKEKVIITCPIHGDFEQRPQDHILKKCGCPKCKAEKTIQVHSYNNDIFLEKAKKVHGDKFDYSKVNYVRYDKPVTIICPIHGEFQQAPKVHYEGSGCPKCGRIKANNSESLSIQDFIERSNKIHGNKYNYSKSLYTGNNDKVIIICPKHGEFTQTPANHMMGQGCPKCVNKGQYALYEKLIKTFPKLDILYEVNNRIVSWLDLQRFDIYIPSLNIAIEYDGIQHYIPVEHFGGELGLKQTQERDKLKEQKCKENGCKLFRLKYDYTNKDYLELCSLIKECKKGGILDGNK